MPYDFKEEERAWGQFDAEIGQRTRRAKHLPAARVAEARLRALRKRHEAVVAALPNVPPSEQFAAQGEAKRLEEAIARAEFALPHAGVPDDELEEELLEKRAQAEELLDAAAETMRTAGPQSARYERAMRAAETAKSEQISLSHEVSRRAGVREAEAAKAHFLEQTARHEITEHLAAKANADVAEMERNGAPAWAIEKHKHDALAEIENPSPERLDAVKKAIADRAFKSDKPMWSPGGKDLPKYIDTVKVAAQGTSEQVMAQEQAREAALRAATGGQTEAGVSP